MGYQDFISETEAAALAGLSTQTLARFAETGYLRVDFDDDGLRLYSKPQLEQLFGLKADQACKRDSAPTPPQQEQTAPVAAQTVTAAEPAIDPAAGTLILERDLARQQQMTELFERLLEVRERQLEELKHERDWLKARIEKLEEKHERDQILLLSENRVIQNLLAQQQRRSPLQLALDWLGFGPIPESAKKKKRPATIEMARVQQVRPKVYNMK